MSATATQNDAPGVTSALVDLDNIISFTDELEGIVVGAKLGTLIKPTPSVLDRYGDVVDPIKNPSFYLSKQDELYFLIRGRVKHSATLAELKKDKIRKDAIGSGTAAWRYVYSLREGSPRWLPMAPLSRLPATTP